MNKNKVILITGCSTGLERALCERLNEIGYIVIASARDLSKITNLSASMKVEIDVTDNDSIMNAVNTIINRYNKIDVLINNAGFSIRGAIEEISTDDVKGLNGSYCASKHAVEAISDALRLELHDYNIQSTVIEPGAMSTNFFNTLENSSSKILIFL